MSRQKTRIFTVSSLKYLRCSNLNSLLKVLIIMYKKSLIIVFVLTSSIVSASVNFDDVMNNNSMQIESKDNSSALFFNETKGIFGLIETNKKCSPSSQKISLNHDGDLYHANQYCTNGSRITYSHLAAANVLLEQINKNRTVTVNGIEFNHI
jgi:hypothetical protein